MRCSSRSTTWRSKRRLAALIGLLAALTAAADGRQGDDGGESAVRHAVVQAVKARMGQDADVRIEELQYKTTPAPDGGVLTASPEPGARLGRQNRFSLQWQASAGARRLPAAAGYAVAKVFVAAAHLRATRDLGRGETCAEADVVPTSGEVGAVLLQKLPGLEDIVGTRVLRPIATGDIVTSTGVQVRPTVSSGDVVAVRASVAGVTALGHAVAQQSGGEGDVIRVVNRDSRRPLKARIVGPGRVEVVQ